MKQKLQNELAEAIIAKNGVPLTISEHEAIVLQVKDELAQARVDVIQGKTSNSAYTLFVHGQLILHSGRVWFYFSSSFL